MATDYVSLVGLVFIAIGWLMQFLHMKNGKKEISWAFVIANCLGIAVLIINAYFSGAYEIAFGNVLTFAGSLAVLYRIKK